MHFSYLVLPPCEDVGEEDIPRSVQVPKRKDISSSVNFAGLEASDHRESSGVPLCTWPLRTRTILHLINGNSPTFLNRSFFLVPISSVEKKKHGRSYIFVHPNCSGERRYVARDKVDDGEILWFFFMPLMFSAIEFD